MKLAAVSYFYATDPSWNRLLKAKPAIAIINPASGPGSYLDPNYAQLVHKLKRADIRVLGYLPTTWAKADPAEIAAQQTKYRSWYRVSDFFYDEAATAPESVRYYEPLVSPCLVPVLNPGTFPDESYMGLKKAIHMVYECGMEEYLEKEPPDWVRNYSPKRFWHCIFGIPTLDEALKVMKVAKKRRAGFVYLTNDKLGADGNPYDALPEYWENLVKAVKKLDAS